MKGQWDLTFNFGVEWLMALIFLVFLGKNS